MVAGASGTALAIFGLLLYIVLDPIQRKAAAYLDEAKRADKGALAEERAGAILQGANPREFWVLHDVVYPGGNIDHVVISKRGSVFAIETKSTKGIVDCCGEQLLVNGAPPQKDYLKQTLRGAMWLNDRIAEATGFKPFVEAVLLFPNASVNVRTTIREVTVSSEWYLSQLLRRHPSSTEQREHLWASRDLIQKQLTGSR